MKVAERFIQAGLHVDSLDDDPSAALRRSGPSTEFAERDDLVVEGWSIEVKCMRNVSFTCRENVPFASIRIGRVEAWHRKATWPLAVVMVSGPTGEAIVLPVRSTNQGWTKETINVRGFSETMYAAPRWWFRSFEDLVEWIRENPHV